jgi:predicted porin
MGYANRSSNMEPKVKSQNAINSGQSSASMLGFKGEEDLGGGNKAFFVLETGFQTDTGAQSDDPFFNEQAYLGLSGNWGTLMVGRLIAPRYNFLGELTPFGDDSMGRYGNVYDDFTYLTRLLSFEDSDAFYTANPNLKDMDNLEATLTVTLANIDRVNNAVAYESPEFSGFKVTAAYAASGLATEGISNKLDARVYTVLPRFTKGGLDVGLSWQRVDIKDIKDVGIMDKSGNEHNTKIVLDQWTLGASYDFEVVKFSAFYDDFTLNTSSGFYNPRMKSWLVGLSAPFKNHAVQLSYTQSELKTARDESYDKASQVAVGYTYEFSKRTNFYAVYAHIANDKKNGTYLRETSVGDAGNGGERYRNGAQFGLKHTF